MGMFNCFTSWARVLFDGVIPTLTGLDGDMWASQLLTLQRKSTLTNFDIGIPFYMPEIDRVELVMFNCPQWGISVRRIELRGNGVEIQSTNFITSCDSFVRLCVPATIRNAIAVSVNFDLDTDSNWTHLAEVTFYNDSTTCPPDTIITTTEMDTKITPRPPGPTPMSNTEVDELLTSKSINIMWQSQVENKY